jgi:pimeloyl-ACP methyl ester carboxylesterase
MMDINISLPMLQQAPAAGNALVIIEAEVHAGVARTRYLRAGAGPTIVLLHGAGENAEVWTTWIGRLATHFRVLAPDADAVVGGEAGRATSPNVEPRTLTIWLRDFLDGLGVESVSFLARGEGTEVAARFTAEYPERVSEVLFVARSLPGRSYPPRAPARPPAA